MVHPMWTWMSGLHRKTPTPSKLEKKCRLLQSLLKGLDRDAHRRGAAADQPRWRPDQRLPGIEHMDAVPSPCDLIPSKGVFRLVQSSASHSWSPPLPSSS